MITLPSSATLSSVTLLAVTLLAAGCAKQDTSPTNTAVYTTETVELPAPVELELVNGVPTWIVAMEENFSKVYFQYDSADLTPHSREALRDNVELMQVHPDVYVMVQGHADERGSAEYNLALGQERARAIKEMFVAAGVSPERVSTISYGEERPLDEDSDRAAWSTNRRAEFVITWGGGEELVGSTAAER